MEQEHQPSYVAYEYKEIEAKGERAALLMDCYQSLGWEAEKETASGKIMLRRSRKIINKAELTRLQRNLEACVAEIDALQKSKTSKAAITSLVYHFAGDRAGRHSVHGRFRFCGHGNAAGDLAVYPAGSSGLYAVGAGSYFISTDGRQADKDGQRTDRTEIR